MLEEDEEIEEIGEEEGYDDKERKIYYDESVVEESKGLKKNKEMDSGNTSTRSLEMKASNTLKQQQE